MSRPLLWIFAVVAAAVVTVYGNPAPYYGVKKPFTIEEAALGTYRILSFSGQWISDVELEYQDMNTKNVRIFNAVRNEATILLKGSILNKYSATTYKFSPDRRFVLMSYNETSVFRHTKMASYVVYDTETGKYHHVANAEKIQVAAWGPRNNTLLFIKDNNIYILKSIHAGMKAIQITFTGVPGVTYNGISDWVYEEEVLASSKAYWFSPNGQQLMYLTLNDTKVYEATMVEYGEPGSIKDQYPKMTKIRYPKSGSPQPQYSLWHVPLGDVTKQTLFERSSENIFYDLKWANDQVFFYVTTNRVQNESKTLSCSIGVQPNCVVTFRHANKKGWANTLLPEIGSNMDRFIRLEGVPVDKFGNFTHLVLYRANGSVTRLTSGFYDVGEILYWDQNNKIVYFSSPEEYKATTLQVFAVSEKGGDTVCLTCEIKSPEGRPCTHATATFSKNASYMVVSCNGPDPKTMYLYKTKIPLGQPLRTLEENYRVRASLNQKQFPAVLNFTALIPGPFRADVRLLLPPNMDTTGGKQYPMIVYVYGGPGSKAISDAFKIDWGLYLSTNLSVIYAQIDGRNTLNKGENMLFAGYKALGTIEMEDQIIVTRQIQEAFRFIDMKRTAIWGWSYGGYATTKILEMDKTNVFKCGIAVAPVADWLYYDSIYTERYMGLPSENKIGYEKSSALKDVSNLRNKKFFLIHGNADDNVHYQNAMMLAKTLEKNNIPFELMSYPDENHSLLHVRNHLYHAMDRFWKKCFDLPTRN